MKIGIGKMGKSMLFSQSKWGLIGGDAAPSILYTSLASINPNITFYIVGRSDFSKLTNEEKSRLFPNNNVIDCWSEADMKNAHSKFHAPLEYVNKHNIKLDAFVMMSGMCSSVNMNDMIWSVKNPGKYSKTLYQFHHYAGPIIHFLNMTQVPMFTISEDPRHIRLNAKDLFNREKFCLSQENSVQKVKHIVNYDDQSTVEYDIPVKYGQTEKIFLIGETKRNTLELKKDIPITMFMNSHTMKSKETRKPFIDEYIHSNFPDSKVYGKWPKELLESDNRYEAIRMGDIMDEVLRTKYTLVVSIKPGFVTCKPWEMINFGIIPFLHPTYDTNNLLGFPEWLHVKDANDFKNKVEFLENNPDKYMKLRELLQDMLEPEFYDGTYMNNLIMSNVCNMIGKEYENANQGTSVKMSSFSEKESVQKKLKKDKKQMELF
tara:strand:+ start:103 stop:1398 length:1296 start_codon:yes stop_codon:yes gene_type:complete